MASFSQTLLISSFLFYATVSSLIVPSIVISLGVALEFRIIDDAMKLFGDNIGIPRWWMISKLQCIV